MLQRIPRQSKRDQLKNWADKESDFLGDLSAFDMEPHVFLRNQAEPLDARNQSESLDAHNQSQSLDSHNQSESPEAHDLGHALGTLRVSLHAEPKLALKAAFSSASSPHFSDRSRRATLSPRVFQDYTEKGDVERSFGAGFELSDVDQAKIKEWVLPATISLPSPSNRRSLSSYSEDTDTDITEMDAEDFEEIDDIFGKEESGIYQAKAPGACAGRATNVLQERRQQLQKEAELEDKELYSRYQSQNDVRTLRQRHHDEAQTLRLKDHRDAQGLHPDADRTVDYEYMKDDLDQFEEGFVGDPSPKISSARLAQFRTPVSGLHHQGSHHPDLQHPGLPHKMSMPSFPQSLRTFKPAKSKSTMDLNGADGSREHPFFNQNNKLIKKLDRMPSFYTSDRKRESHNGGDNRTPNRDPGGRDNDGDPGGRDKDGGDLRKSNSTDSTGSREDSNTLDKNDRRTALSAEDIDYNMELHKKQLLEKYMEITEKQMQLRSSPKRKKAVAAGDGPRKNIGLLKNLNHQSYAPVVEGPRKMRFNASAKTWEGNEHDLLRFEEAARGLITSDQFAARGQAGNMKYDAKNLRWVNMDSADEESENVFRDLSDLEADDLPRYARAGLETSAGRGVSTFTQRTVLSTSSTSARSPAYIGEEFHLSHKALTRFEKEEAKIRKKTQNWFGANEAYGLSPRAFDLDYCWDIRKMVMDDATSDG